MATSRLRLPLFETSHNDEEFLGRFDLMKGHLNWSNEALFQLSFISAVNMMALRATGKVLFATWSVRAVPLSK